MLVYTVCLEIISGQLSELSVVYVTVTLSVLASGWLLFLNMYTRRIAEKRIYVEYTPTCSGNKLTRNWGNELHRDALYVELNVILTSVLSTISKHLQYTVISPVEIAHVSKCNLVRTDCQFLTRLIIATHTVALCLLGFIQRYLFLLYALLLECFTNARMVKRSSYCRVGVYCANCHSL